MKKIHTVSESLPPDAFNKTLFWSALEIQGDHSYPFDTDILLKRGYLFVVAVGSGSPVYALETCKLSVDTLIKEYYQKPVFVNAPTQLQEAYQVVNQATYDYIVSNPDEPSWGNCMVAAVLQEDELTVANIGDTGAYLIRRDKSIESLAPLDRPHLPPNLALLVPVLGFRPTSLPVRTINMDPIPMPLLYIDLISRIKFGPEDILILTNSPVARPSWLEEQKIIDLVQYPVDKRIAQRLGEMVITSYPRNGGKTIAITAIWFD